MKQEYIDLLRKTVSDNFYDKKIYIYNAIEKVGEELDVVRTKGDLKEELACNVHIIGDNILKQDYGLNIQANIMVTCIETLAKKGDIITYNNQDYNVVEIIKNDSHTKIFGDSNA